MGMIRKKSVTSPIKKALSEATRAISGANDLKIKFESESASIGESQVQLSRISSKISQNEMALARGEADSVAMHLRYHNKEIAKKYSPVGDVALSLFNEMEKARCEAVGALTYPGASKNIDLKIDTESKKLIQNSSNPNLILIDVLPEKKMIDISQIRKVIENLNKSSFNSKPRFILIDNIEFLNINSINAMLKVLEEPNINIFFLLINNNKRIQPTLKSRCLNYKLYLTHNQSVDISNKIIASDALNLINDELLDYYSTPGKIYSLYKFSKENNIELDKLTLRDPFCVGVPTQINIISEELTAFFKSVVKINLFAKEFFLINSFKPGS